MKIDFADLVNRVLLFLVGWVVIVGLTILVWEVAMEYPRIAIQSALVMGALYVFNVLVNKR